MTPDRLESLLDQLDQDLESRRDEIAGQLARLMMFNTVSGSADPDEQRLSRNEITRAFSFLRGLAKQMGFEWRNYENRVCVIEQGGGAEIVGVPLHIDVVPSGDGWKYPAFGGMIEDGILYGRGAQDNKGPIVQTLYALDALRRLGRPFRRGVRLIVASQEETGDWSDVEDYLEREPAPDFCMVPDARFPIVNGEKGMMDLEIVLRWEGEIEGESLRQFRALEGGERPNIVPNRADITWYAPTGQARGISEVLKRHLEGFLREHPGADCFPLRVGVNPDEELRQLHLTFLGKSAHGSRPELGRNALIDALRFVCVVPEMPERLTRAAEFLVRACADNSGQGLGIAARHDTLGPTTVNLGMLQIDKGQARAVLNIRNTLGQSCDQALEAARRATLDWAAENGMQAEVAFRGSTHEPIYLDPADNAQWLEPLQQAFQRVTGEPATLECIGGSTFAKAFPRAVVFGPVYDKQEQSLAHQADERIHIDHLLRNTRIYAAALALLALDPEAPADDAEAPRKGLGLGL